MTAGGLLASAVGPLAAFAAGGGCTPASCPDGTCCEGRCLSGSFFGCCHDKIYSRLNKQCCPQAPPGGDHTCLDGEECCGKTACCKDEQLCCDGRCLPGPKTRVGCCNGATYDLRSEECCPEQPRGALEFHVCSKDEECCGEKNCCKGEELCCDGRCLPGPKSRVGCCNGATYDKRSEQCCLEQPSGELEFHVCSKDEQCCGEKACCAANEECCGSHCASKGTCGGCPAGEVRCGTGCCPQGQCQNGTCLCGGEVCTAPDHCCHGTQCCGGPCCHESCCVNPTDQCCSNNGGCCGARDICCPGGCCIYGCADGGCAGPPTSPDVVFTPRSPTLARRPRR